jgi:hypothetical protein
VPGHFGLGPGSGRAARLAIYTWSTSTRSGRRSSRGSPEGAFAGATEGDAEEEEEEIFGGEDDLGLLHGGVGAGAVHSEGGEERRAR